MLAANLLSSTNLKIKMTIGIQDFLVKTHSEEEWEELKGSILETLKPIEVAGAAASGVETPQIPRDQVYKKSLLSLGCRPYL